MEFEGQVILIHLSYFFSLASFSLRNITYLRVAAISSSIVTIYYASTAYGDPQWIPVLWNCFFIIANSIHLFLVRWRSREVRLDPMENFLSKTVLGNFPSAEVRTFASFAKEGTLNEGNELIKQGTELNILFCLLSGNADIISNGEKVGELGPGRFLGEMSLLTQSKTRADVKAASELRFLAWTHDDIEKWVDSDASRLGLLQAALGTQVVEILLRQEKSAEDIQSRQAA